MAEKGAPKSPPDPPKRDEQPIERHLKAKDIREILGVSRGRAYQIIEECTRVKFSKNLRVPESAFKEWLENHTLRVRPAESVTEAHSAIAQRAGSVARATVRRWVRKTAKAPKRPSSESTTYPPIRPSLPRDSAPAALPDPNAPPRLRLPIRPSRPRD